MNPCNRNQLYRDCTLCPRRCHANRFERGGFCGAGTMPKLARAGLHYWEEPCISGTSGSGAIFFSHCTLRCVFCQNHEISAGGFGLEIDVPSLADAFLSLQEKGAANINLVTASHYLPSVLDALDLVRPRLTIPVVYNCGGYESVETLRMLEGYVDIYLPDFKYADDALARRYSAAPDYLATATEAIREMLRQVGPPQFRDASAMANPRTAAQPAEDASANAPAEDSLLLARGVIIRHMVLPGHRQDSLAVIRHLADSFPREQFLISLLRQYTPFYLAASDPALHKLNRRLTSFEYDSVAEEALRLGLNGFRQERSSASEEYTPAFDLEGVPGKP